MSLVLSALAVEHDTLAGFLGPSGIAVGNLRLLGLDVVVESLGGDRLLAEPEEVLHEAELPGAC